MVGIILLFVELQFDPGETRGIIILGEEGWN
jgi:hypothetical protein